MYTLKCNCIPAVHALVAAGCGLLHADLQIEGRQELLPAQNVRSQHKFALDVGLNCVALGVMLCMNCNAVDVC